MALDRTTKTEEKKRKNLPENGGGKTMSTLPSKRSDALKIGAARYCTGKPCANGHVAERETLSAACIDCKGLYLKRERDAFKSARACAAVSVAK